MLNVPIAFLFRCGRSSPLPYTRRFARATHPPHGTRGAVGGVKGFALGSAVGAVLGPFVDSTVKYASSLAEDAVV